MIWVYRRICRDLRAFVSVVRELRVDTAEAFNNHRGHIANNIALQVFHDLLSVGRQVFEVELDFKLLALLLHERVRIFTDFNAHLNTDFIGGQLRIVIGPQD